MTTSIDTTMLLAAGLGTRLRPLTLSTPKPLLPLDGTLLIDHQLGYLRAAGVRRAVINLHHLGAKIRDHVGDGSRFGIEVRYSEEPEILGTGGGIKKAEAFLGEGSFLALNADALIDADIAAVVRRHEETKAAATMVVRPLGHGDGYTPVDIGPDSFVRGFGTGRHFYTGLQILGREMLDILPPAGQNACLIQDGYEALLAKGERVSSFVHEGYFNDLGTPERYEQAKRDIAAGRFRTISKQKNG